MFLHINELGWKMPCIQALCACCFQRKGSCGTQAKTGQSMIVPSSPPFPAKNLMHYALDFRTFLYSHYFYTGLRIASGIIFAIMFTINMADIVTTMTVFLGALCTSIMDLPSPLRHKFNEMLAGLLLCTFVMLIISLSAPIAILVTILMVSVCFFASMMLVYGKKTMPMQFTALLVMTLAMSHALPAKEALIHTGLFFGGGFAYLLYSMVISYFLQRRFKQQILSESLFELASYLRIKSGFYDINCDLAGQFNLLVRQQILLADKQQAARDLILRDIQPKHDGRLIQIHLAMLDLYEQVLSTHADYELLRDHFGDTDVMMFLRNVARKTATDLEGIAYAITRNKCSTASVSYKAELRAIEFELLQLQQDVWGRHIPNSAITVLHATYNKIRDMIDLINRLHLSTQASLDAPSSFSKENVTPFLTQQKYKLDLLRSHMHWKSPFFRFSVRVALAVLTGLWIGSHLPYMSYPHWIVLTIIIILKPNFSSTKQRLNDRLTGTVIGCAIAMIALRFIPSEIGLLGVLFLASIAAPAFATLKYRYTAIAASVQILILMNMLTPDDGSHLMVGERLIDTIIGISLAAAFSYVLPSWEYHGVSELVKNVLQSNQRYMNAGRELFSDKTSDDFLYRICRKDFMNNLAALIDALVRMTDEPSNKQRATKELNLFVIQNYLVTAHVAALRIILKRYSSTMPRNDVRILVAHTFTMADKKLREALQILLAHTAQPSSTNAAPNDTDISAPEFVLESETPEMTNWSGWHTLQRRADRLTKDLMEIIKQTEAISQALAYQPDITDPIKKPPTQSDRR
jgi:uncharacterized membrane protein YccC